MTKAEIVREFSLEGVTTNEQGESQGGQGLGLKIHTGPRGRQGNMGAVRKATGQDRGDISGGEGGGRTQEQFNKGIKGRVRWS